MFEIDRMKELIERLNKYRDAYYNQNTSLITDREYDSLYDKLCQMEKESGLILSNSPTQSVGYEIRSKLPKVKHNHPLLSLDKTTDTQEFLDFFGGKEFILMAKLDGLTVSIKYDKGKFVSAETRGDGEIGEDISHNAPMFKNLPLTIPYDGELIVDGECIIYEDELQKINKRENTDYKNVRNLVSGTVRQLDSKICANRNVYFIAWKLQTMPKSEYYHYSFTQPNPQKPPRPVVDLNLHNDRLQFLSDLGFDTVKRLFITQNKNLSTLEAYIHWLKSSCELLHMPIDGMVGMFNDIKYGESLGMTGHHPKHSLAFKFYQEENETTLKDIEWSTSRTGLVNPVAIFEPVEIDGTTVTRATLNNVSIIKELELGIGDTITVIKANQIIPMVTQNLTRSKTYKIPEVCPSCGHLTVIKNDNGRETLYCTNANCKAMLHDKVANFASRNAMNIVGISEERLKILIDKGYINQFADIYKLDKYRTEIEKLQGFGKSSVDNLLKAIEDSRKCKLSNVIVAIGIPNIGKSTAQIIAEYVEQEFDSVNKMYSNKLRGFLEAFLYMATGNIKKYNWSRLPGIGDKTSEEINNYVSKMGFEINALVNELEILSEDKLSSNKLMGKTFCITGKLEHFDNRAALVYDIETHGGKVVSSVTKKTDYLITNDKTSGSSKNKAAEKYGTIIITEDEYVTGIM